MTCLGSAMHLNLLQASLIDLIESCSTRLTTIIGDAATAPHFEGRLRAEINYLRERTISRNIPGFSPG